MKITALLATALSLLAFASPTLAAGQRWGWSDLDATSWQMAWADIANTQWVAAAEAGDFGAALPDEATGSV